jgi:hypothetical protein
MTRTSKRQHEARVRKKNKKLQDNFDEMERAKEREQKSERERESERERVGWCFFCGFQHAANQI